MKLEIGYSHIYEIRREAVEAKIKNDFSLLFISDLHLNRFNEALIQDLKTSIDELDPDVILLGGDYVDSKIGFENLKRLFLFLSHRKNVYAIPGNHDLFFGKEKISDLAIEHKIHWLENSQQMVIVRDNEIMISNNPDYAPKSEFNILCLHRPVPFKKIAGEFHLALAGHLHGGQFILWQNEKGLYPGKYFYRQNFLKQQNPSATYLISKGLGDTLPVRLNCKKDIIFVNIKASL